MARCILLLLSGGKGPASGPALVWLLLAQSADHFGGALLVDTQTDQVARFVVDRPEAPVFGYPHRPALLTGVQQGHRRGPFFCRFRRRSNVRSPGQVRT